MYVDLLNLIEEVTGLPVYFSHTKTVHPCIVYTVNPVSDNGVKAVEQLSLRIIHNSVKECYTADLKLRESLLGWDVTKGEYTKIRLNGGGYTTHEETKTVHKLSFYYITKKSEVMK